MRSLGTETAGLSSASAVEASGSSGVATSGSACSASAMEVSSLLSGTPDYFSKGLNVLEAIESLLITRYCIGFSVLSALRQPLHLARVARALRSQDALIISSERYTAKVVGRLVQHASSDASFCDARQSRATVSVAC